MVLQIYGIMLKLFYSKLVNSIIHEHVIYLSPFITGTTWLQEIIYLIERGVDDKSASEENLEQRVPYLEFIYPGIKEIAKREGQRLLKTHMPLSLLPAEARAGKGKVCYGKQFE